MSNIQPDPDKANCKVSLLIQFAGKTQFGPFELNNETAELFRDGQQVRLFRQSALLLVILVQRAGQLVTREELRVTLWPEDTYVDFDHGLNNCISRIRHALGDAVDSPTYIQTLSKQGYRFIGKVRTAADFVDPHESPSSLVPVAIGLSQMDFVETPATGEIAESAAGPPALFHEGANDMGQEGKRTDGTRNRRWKWVLPAAALLAGGFAIAVSYVRRTLPPPHLTDIVQITHGDYTTSLAGSDGSKLYFNQFLPPYIAQVGIAGGNIVPVQVGLPSPHILDVSPDRSALLVNSLNNGKSSLWSFEIQGGAVRLLASDGLEGAWSPDGKSLIYSTPNGEVFVTPSDMPGARIVVSAETLGQHSDAGAFAWSPDGSKIRFSAWSKAHTSKLFEMSSDGSGLHELLPGWRPWSVQCCGRWTPDGSLYLFLSLPSSTIGSPSGGQIWVIDERRGLNLTSHTEPVLLTSGAIQWQAPIPSKDGRKIFALGTILRGELVRYDAQSKQFQPFLGGISAEFVTFSRDRKSIAYVSFPDGILWIADRDGSNPRQLTNSPLYATLPQWSPDGSQILFFGSDMVNHSSRAYVISPFGGSPQPILPDDKGVQTDPNWSPDGSRIVFSTGGAFDVKSDIRILNLASHEVSILPGSVGMSAPRWSPDGRLIVALEANSADLKVFEFETQRWSLLHKGWAGFPAFSHNGQFIYFKLSTTAERGVFRIRTSGGVADRVVNLGGLKQTGFYSSWFGLDTEDRTMLLRDTGSNEIYATTLETK